MKWSLIIWIVSKWTFLRRTGRGFDPTKVKGSLLSDLMVIFFWVSDLVVITWWLVFTRHILWEHKCCWFCWNSHQPHGKHFPINQPPISSLYLTKFILESSEFCVGVCDSDEMAMVGSLCISSVREAGGVSGNGDGELGFQPWSWRLWWWEDNGWERKGSKGERGEQVRERENVGVVPVCISPSQRPKMFVQFLLANERKLTPAAQFHNGWIVQVLKSNIQKLSVYF